MNKSGLLQEEDIPYALKVIEMFRATSLSGQEIVEMLRRIVGDIEYEAVRYTGPRVVYSREKEEHKS